MTFKDLDTAIPEEQEERQTVPFDWTSEKYLLMCREYLLALGWKNPKDMECELQTESEKQYWEEFHRVQGYGVPNYGIVCYDFGAHKWAPKIVIDDPPEEFQLYWAKQNGIELTTSDTAEPEEGRNSSQ